MKLKKMIALIVTLIITSGLNAQCRRVCAGVKAGLTSANIYGIEGENFLADPKLGLSGGIFLEVAVGNYFGIQPEVLFTQKGFKASGTVERNSYSLDRTTTYIDVPLLLQIKPASFIHFVIGPQYSYLTDKKDMFNLNNMTVEQTEQFVNNELRQHSLGATGGVDIHIRRVVLSGRVGTDLQDNNGSGTQLFPRYKNNWMQVMLGFRF